MKKIITSLMLFVAFAGATTISSCTKTCDSGFEGSDCKTEIREKFIGVWHGNETCTTGTDTYNITITKSSTDALIIIIENVYNNGSPVITVTATVSGTTFTVASQTVSGITINGTGTLTNNSLSFAYTAVSGAITNSCTFVATKL